jgi:hypothetical protein
MFEFSMEAAIHNSKILETYGYDLTKAIEAEGFSHLSMGSELRPLNQLRPLIGHHPYFHELEEMISNGISYPAPDLPEDTRVQQLKAQIKKGNQKSALTDDAIPVVTNLIKDDIGRGYSIIVTVDCLHKLKHCEVYPYGLQHQTSIDHQGNTIPKKRLTHNLSANKKSRLSINQRVVLDELTDTQYGFALLRHLHTIHTIRFNNPNERILCNKVDIDKAFRRLHTSPKISSKCCSTWNLHNIDSEGKLVNKSNDTIGTILTRLPFGSSPAPHKFSIFSEISFDLANDLMHCDHWDPEESPPPLHDQIPQPQRLDPSIPFGTALPADVPLPSNTKGRTEGYLDDATNAVLDSPGNSKMVARARLCNLMALHLLCRPLAGLEEPIMRSEIASIRKLLAEGALSEIYTFLGWLINTRAFLVALPHEKWKNWSQSIEHLLTQDVASYNELATLLGRLEHVCFIIPAARHFMNRLRRSTSDADTFRVTKLSKEVKLDLKLWIQFLQKAEGGISINNIIFRSPTSVPITDASETGIGGHCPQNNILWRYKFTIEEQISLTLNAKEYLAAAIGAWIALQNDDCNHPCILSLSDNSSTVAWLHKSNHDPTSSPIHNAIGRWHARNLLSHDACDYSQHIQGSENLVADSLSRDFHLNDNEILTLLSKSCPHLLPDNPQVISLPTQISSWIGTLAHLEPRKRELTWQQKPSTLAAGEAGSNSPSSPRSTTPTSNYSPPSTKPESSAHSWMLVETDNSASNIPLRAKPLPRPQTMWLRPSSKVVGQTQERTNRANLSSCSHDRRRATQKQTHQPSTKKHSLP